MAAFASLTLNDGQATPVAHQFAPVTIDASGVAFFEDRESGISIGFPRVSQQVRRPSKTSRNYRVTQKVVLPILEVTSPSTASGLQPAPTVAYTLQASMEFILPERSTAADRENIKAYASALMLNELTSAAVVHYDSPY